MYVYVYGYVHVQLLGYIYIYYNCWDIYIYIITAGIYMDILYTQANNLASNTDNVPQDCNAFNPKMSWDESDVLALQGVIYMCKSI
jgi:hypothetical protein